MTNLSLPFGFVPWLRSTLVLQKTPLIKKMVTKITQVISTTNNVQMTCLHIFQSDLDWLPEFMIKKRSGNEEL